MLQLHSSTQGRTKGRLGLGAVQNFRAPICLTSHQPHSIHNQISIQYLSQKSHTTETKQFYLDRLLARLFLCEFINHIAEIKLAQHLVLYAHRVSIFPRPTAC